MRCSGVCRVCEEVGRGQGSFFACAVLCAVRSVPPVLVGVVWGSEAQSVLRPGAGCVWHTVQQASSGEGDGSWRSEV